MNAFYFGTGYLISYSGTGFPRFQPAPTGHSIEPWLEGDLTEMHACGLWFNTRMGEPGVLANRSSLAPKRGHSRQVKWISIAYFLRKNNLSVRFRNDCSWSSVTQSCPTLCKPMDCSMRGLPVHHQLLERTQTHVHQVGDAIQPSDPLSSRSPPAFNLSQHQDLFK